ncbi:hypothetical protein HPB48_001486 [Haemaphysalis longicornis]|uniref:Uncharacterized protein n=1 Tax=Haemaphysalis longicornis TaxID=44386 RepID=A0A9J6FGX9_HAELO|nr:hypothetical protein HPB48_001486 [Haemaphysalis longicornis]
MVARFAFSILKGKIESVQLVPLLAMSGAVRTVRTEALDVLTGTLPICGQLDALRFQFHLCELRRDIVYGSLELKAAEVQRRYDP